MSEMNLIEAWDVLNRHGIGPLLENSILVARRLVELERERDEARAHADELRQAGLIPMERFAALRAEVAKLREAMTYLVSAASWGGGSLRIATKKARDLLAALEVKP